MLPSIHGEDVRLPGVLAAVDEDEVGDGGLDEGSKAGAKVVGTEIHTSECVRMWNKV
jgi:hypothetical protein